MPIHLTEVVGWRTAKPDEIPGGAAAIAKKAEKSGWKVSVSFMRVPWLTADEDDDADAGLVEVIAVHGRKDGKKFRATWHCKLWTKAGDTRSFSFFGAAMWPPIEGEVIASKGKKDRNPEHLGDKTVGGLKNSKVLNTFLKEV
jgi:hypothetical protein